MIKFPAIAIEDEKYRKQGEALWPSMYDLESLMETKKVIQDDWSSLYQQDPIEQGESEFKKEWFKRWDTLPELKIQLIVDLASSSDKRSDENAICVVGWDKNEKMYVLDSWGDWGDEGKRCNPEQMIEKILIYADKWCKTDPHLQIHVETVSYQLTLMHWLKSKMQERARYRQKVYHIEEIKTPNTKSKDDKIRGLIPFFSIGNVFLPRNGTQTLEEQMLRFPKASKVDRLDTLSMALEIKRKPQRVYAPIRFIYDKTGRPLKMLSA